MSGLRRTDTGARPWVILLVLCMASFLIQLDVAVLAVALPTIQADLRATTEQLVWALSVYILVLAVVLVTAGRLGDLVGRRRVFLLGVAVFTVASIAAGMAQSPAQLIAARAVQGFGAALLTPQTLALLVDTFPAERRGLALGVRGAVSGVAAIAGPVFGGLLTDALHWRWVFYINVPLGIGMLVLGWLQLPTDGARREHRLDIAGVMLGSATLLGVAFAIDRSDRPHWGPAMWATLGGSLCCAAAFVVQQRSRQDADPLVPFALFHNRNFALMIGYSLTTSSIVVGLVLVLSLFFQSSLELDPMQAGLMIVPASLMSTIFDPLAGRLADRLDGRVLLLAGAVLTFIGILWTAAQMRVEADWTTFIAPVSVIGIGNAFLFTPVAVIAMGGVTSEQAGAASGILVTALQIGSMLGAAVTGAILQDAGPALITVGTARTALLALAGIAAVGAIVSVGVRRPAPATLLASDVRSSVVPEPARKPEHSTTEPFHRDGSAHGECAGRGVSVRQGSR